MKINVGTMYTTVDFGNDVLLKEKVQEMAHNLLGIKEEGAFYSRAFKSGFWDGITDFYNMKEDKFHTGLLDQFLDGMRTLVEHNPSIKYEIVDNRPPALVSPNAIDEEIILGNGDEDPIILRDYQYNSVKSVFEEQVGIINVATNGGKCLVKTSKLLTSEGYKTIEQIFKENGTPCEVADKAVPVEVELVNRYGQLEKTSHLTFNGMKPVRKLLTDSGVELTTTYNHPLLVVTNQGDFEWKEMEHVAVGDKLVTRMGDNVYGTNNTADSVEAYLVGALVADGYLGVDYKIGFSNDQEALLSCMENYFKTLTRQKVERTRRPNSKGVDLNMYDTTAVRDWHTRLGIGYGRAKDKRIPQCIMEAPKQTQLAFLSGYMECEAAIDTDKAKIEVTSASKELLQQVQLVLKNMGVLSTLREKVVKGYEQNYYGRLNIRSKYAVKLLSLLVFKTEQRTAQATQALESYTARTKRPFKESVPNGHALLEAYRASIPGLNWEQNKKFKTPKTSQVGRDRVRRLLEEFPDGDKEVKTQLELLIDEHIYFDTVDVVGYLGEEPTFDVCMPETHSFIAEGIVNHNTEIASGVIQQVLPYLKRGQRVAFFTHSREIFGQSAERIAKRVGLKLRDVGFIGDGKFDVKNKKIVFVMVPTLVSALKDPKKGIKFTPKERVIKMIAEDIVPKFKNTQNTRQLIRNYIKNCNLTTNVWLDVEQHLSYVAYDKKFTDKSAQMHLNKYTAEFTKIMEKKNKKKFQKYNETMEFLESVTVMIADEVHHSKADTWYTSLSLCENAIYRVGLTGTVDKKDKMGWQRLQALFSQVVVRVSNEYLIDKGISSKPTIRLLPITEPRNIELASNFLEAYKLGIVENEYRNKIIADLVESYHKRKPGGILVSVKEIAHGDYILESLRNRGLEVEFIHGGSDADHRATQLSRFSKGELKILIASTIIDEGVDMKSIGCMVLAAGGKSMRQQLQRIGRGLRLNGIDGNSVMVFDFMDRTNIFLLNHSKERVKLFQSEKFDVKVLGE